MDTVTQMAWGNPIPCPVCQWVAVVKQIKSYSGAGDKTPGSMVWHHGRMDHITSKSMTETLESGVAAVGYDKVGIKKGEIGTHLIRSGAAMAM
ncbi:hypothetical protein ACHAXS_001055 [Conticribra weissflogii]